MSEIKLTQNQRLQQEQVLSPVMMHSLDLLATPILELETKINQELEQNPVLEREEDDFSDTTEALNNEETPEEDVLIPEKEKPISDIGEYESSVDDDGEDDSQFDDSKIYDYYDHENISGKNNPTHNDINEKREFLFNSVLKEKTIEEDLIEQISFLTISDEEKERCELIIGSLNEQGFFTSSLADLAVISGSDLAQMQEALEIVQLLEPPGVGSRNIKESLLIQLKRDGNSDLILSSIIENYLKEVASNHLPVIAKKLHITIEELKTKIEKIRKLNPYPYSGVGSGDKSIFVRTELKIQEEGGEFVIISNNDFLPRIRIASKYLEMLSDDKLSKETRDYIKEKILSAGVLIKSIEQRHSTLKRIAEIIIDEQYDFFKSGLLHLKPLTMKQVADKLAIHEATVSRAVSGKYIDSPQGVLPMKYFFSSGFKTENGEMLANKGIMEKIKSIIDAENPEKPYSDEDLAEILKKDGLSIARRTVAKYREEMKIPSSRLRREYI